MRCNLSFLPSNFVELKIVTLLVVTCSHLLFSERSSFMAAFFLCLRLGCKKLQPCHCSFCDTYSRRLLHRCVALMDVNLLHMSPYLLQLLHYMKEFTQQRRQNTVVICASTLARNTAFSQKLHKTTPISLKKERFATFCQK